MKKHEIIDYAHRNYPSGTKFKWYKHDNPFTSNAVFKFAGCGLFIETEEGDITLMDCTGKWAEIVSDKQPLWIAEDDTEMFEDSECHWVYEHNGKWHYNSRIDFCKNHVDLVKSRSHIHRVFGTEENAHNWIEKANKPKEIEIEFDDHASVIIKIDCITFNGSIKCLSIHQLTQINNALKQLQL